MHYICYVGILGLEGDMKEHSNEVLFAVVLILTPNHGLWLTAILDKNATEIKKSFKDII